MKKTLLFMAAISVSAFAGPYDSWGKYRTVTVNTTTAAVTGTVTNYPLLVRLTSASAATGSDVLADDATGASLRFASSDGETEYDYEIDTWTASAAAVWVKVPAVAGSSATGAVVRMYWNKDGASDASDGNAVFSPDNGFAGVWHLGNASGVDPRPNAITGRNPAVPKNFGGGYPATAYTGIIGKADSLTGGLNGSGGVPAARTYLSIDSTAAGSASNHYNFSDGNFAFTGWVNPQGTIPLFTRIFGINSANTFVGGGDNRIFLSTASTGTVGQLVSRHGAGSTTNAANSSDNPAGRLVSGEWNHVAMTISRGSTYDTVRIFRNGVHLTGGIPYTTACGDGAAGTSCGLRPIAQFPNTARGHVSLGRDFINQADNVFNGKIDEARFASARRSVSWIKLDFETQKASVTAVALGETQTQGGGDPTVPGAPTGVSGTAGAGSVSVAFTAPSSDGGAAITGYTVTSDPGGFSNTGASSPIVVSGLANGTGYTFTVTATNSVGPGPASSPSSSVTPRTVPGAPTGVVGTAGDGQVSVVFTAPSNDGGAAITGYTVTSDPGGFSNTGASSPIVVSGLANGTGYTFTVVATNSAGPGPASSASSPVTPAAAAVVPGAPTGVAGTAGAGSVSVVFTAPASDGGAAITGYTVTSDPGGFSNTGATSPIVVSGLANGTHYTFTVVATNSVGPGPTSSASSPVTPRTVPGAPTGVSGTPGGAGSGQVTVGWTAPVSDGGATITAYTATAATSPGGVSSGTCGWTAGPLTCTVGSLTGGSSYTFTVVATNAAGPGAASTASAPVLVPVGVVPGSVVFRVSGAARPYTFVLPAGSPGTDAVTMRVMDLWGRTVWSGTLRASEEGARALTWNGRSSNGRAVSAGMYVARVTVVRDGKATELSGKGVTLDPR